MSNFFTDWTWTELGFLMHDYSSNFENADYFSQIIAYQICCCIKTSSSCKKPDRSFANFNSEQFREDLQANMQIFYNQFLNISENNIENQFAKLRSLITATIDKHAPLRNLTKNKNVA